MTTYWLAVFGMGLVACAVAWHFRLTFVTIAAGLAALHLFAWLA